MESLLQIEEVSKSFGGLRALSQVSFSVHPDEILGVIGPNGAGKTTLFNLLMGVYPFEGGDIQFRNESLKGLPGYKIAARGIGRTFQNIRLFKDISVLANIMTAYSYRAHYSVMDALLRTRRYKKQEKEFRIEAEYLLDLFGLREYQHTLSAELPYGLQRKLEIARAMALKPELLLLDEPAAGMNATETDQLLKLVARLKDEFNCTLMIIEHDMSFINRICERIVVLDHGEVLAEGAPEEIRQNPKVIEAYLGSSAQV